MISRGSPISGGRGLIAWGKERERKKGLRERKRRGREKVKERVKRRIEV